MFNKCNFLIIIILFSVFAGTDKQKNGTIKTFYKSGKLESKITYKTGCPVDTGYFYYENGKLNGITIFIKCDSVTNYVNYYENGDTAACEFNGQYKSFYQGRKIRSAETISRDRKKNGISIEYFENGQPKDSALYKEDKSVWSKSFFSTGKLRLYYKEIKDGKILEGYSYSPKSKLTGSIKNGNGTLLIYHGDGTGPDTMTFKDGEDEW